MQQAPISSTPFSAVSVPRCVYCKQPNARHDIPSIITLVQKYSLPLGLCLRCALDELEDLKLPLDDPAPPVVTGTSVPLSRGYARGYYALLSTKAIVVSCKEVP